MRRAACCTAVALAAALLVPAGAVSNPAGASTSGSLEGEFAFAFVVGRHGSAAIYDKPADTPVATAGALADGQVLAGPDMIRALSTSSSAGGAGTGSAFSEAELIAHVEDLRTGEISSAVVAQCPTLDFETNAGSPFEQQVICGKERFAYAGTSQGIEVIRAGKTALSFRLEAGLYTVNGVPFLVKRQP